MNESNKKNTELCRKISLTKYNLFSCYCSTYAPEKFKSVQLIRVNYLNVSHHSLLPSTCHPNQHLSTNMSHCYHSRSTKTTKRQCCNIAYVSFPFHTQVRKNTSHWNIHTRVPNSGANFQREFWRKRPTRGHSARRPFKLS